VRESGYHGHMLRAGPEARRRGNFTAACVGILLVISMVVALVIALAMYATISTARAVGVMIGRRHSAK
jgi:hypothetical protein